MKSMLFFLIAVILAFGAHSQAITITASKSVTPGSVDSCAEPTAAALSALPSLGTPASNASWDLSAVAVKPTFVTYAYRARTAGFPTAGFSDSTTYSLSASPIYSYKAWRNIEQKSTGIFIQGEEVLTRQAKSLQPVTGASVDSLIYPTQVVNFNTTPLRIIKYPATNGSVWVDSTARSLSFSLNVPAYMLNYAPGQHKQRRIYVDSVVGWGRMKVPIVGKTASKWINVLQVHHWETNVDSFFLNGSPAPAPALSALGLSQGQRSSTLYTYFYRAGLYRPLLEYVHSAPVQNSSARTLYIHAVELEEETSVPGHTSDELSVYPLPVRASGALQVRLPNPDGRWNYTISSLLGQRLLSDELNVSAPDRAEIALPSTLTPGKYFITLVHSSGRRRSLPILIQ